MYKRKMIFFFTFPVGHISLFLGEHMVFEECFEYGLKRAFCPWN